VIERTRRIITHPAVKAAYLLLLLAAAGFYLARWGDRLPDLLSRVQPLWAAAALIMSCLSALVYIFIQYDIYHRLGARPSYGSVFRIVTISQLGKYLPGKIAFVGNYYLFSRAAGINNARIGTSFVISMSLWMLTASLCGLPVLSLLDATFRYVVLALPLLLALFIHPRILSWLLGFTQRVFGRLRGSSADDPPAKTQTIELTKLGIPFYLRAALLYLATWTLAGLGAYMCLAAFTPVPLEIYPLALASIALGTVGGFLALFAPVGLGVREGIGALILAPAVGADVALLSMMLLRGVTVVADLALALLAMITKGHVEPDCR
jgi:hypothetical protein